MNCELNTLDELIRKAVEEEPYVAVQKSSLETDKSFTISHDFYNKAKYNNFKLGLNSHPSPSKPNFNRNYDNYNYRPINFDNNKFQQNHGRNDYNNQRPFRNSYDQRNSKFCIRCKRGGHTSDNCYARLTNDQANAHAIDNDLATKVKEVSFLEVPQIKRPVLDPRQNSWSQTNRK